MFASIQTRLDQINVMTYDLSGPYEGWVTWFDSPIYDGGSTFPTSERLLPSIEGAIQSFLDNGVAPAKLGVGTPFYGYVWTGGTGTSGGTTLPRQSWFTPPVTTTVAYNKIMATYYQSNIYHWDDAAQAAYLSITNPVSTNDQFISYDDEHSTEAKVSYARNHFLGGLMIWELSQDYQPMASGSQRHRLLASIKAALATPGPTIIHKSNTDILLSFTTAPLATYRVLSTTNLSGSAWITLTENLPGGSNGIATAIATDRGAALDKGQCFYRVQTPP